MRIHDDGGEQRVLCTDNDDDDDSSGEDIIRRKEAKRERLYRLLCGPFCEVTLPRASFQRSQEI